tara:strand:+ start:532 stop:726 length:195 start_codon:yes stop_codon:yes gene_type:complete
VELSPGAVVETGILLIHEIRQAIHRLQQIQAGILKAGIKALANRTAAPLCELIEKLPMQHGPGP